MNRNSQWRLAIARPIAASYARNPKVAAVIVGGSTSHGHADRWSDIEIGVFWDEPPTEEDRRLAAEESGAELHRLHPYEAEYEVWSDDLYVGRAASDQYGSGVQVEIPHYTVAYMERVLDDVLVGHDASDLEKQNLVAAIIPAIPVHGDAVIQGWRSRAADYPRELAMAMVKRHAQIEFLWTYEMFLERGDNLVLVYDKFAQVSKQFLYVLLGLNRIYYSGLKWMNLIAPEIRIAPPDFYGRLQRVFRSEPNVSAEELRGLVEETYTLIEQEMPEIDVERLRYFFRYQRQTWDQPPPGTL